MYVYMCMCIYIYIERERARERDLSLSIYIYMYVWAHNEEEHVEQGLVVVHGLGDESFTYAKLHHRILCICIDNTNTKTSMDNASTNHDTNAHSDTNTLQRALRECRGRWSASLDKAVCVCSLII